jgi:hypothetical protein
MEKFRHIGVESKLRIATMRVDEGVLNTETIFKRLINNRCIRCGKAKEKGEVSARVVKSRTIQRRRKYVDNLVEE